MFDVTTAVRVEPAMPNLTSLPSMFPPDCSGSMRNCMSCTLMLARTRTRRINVACRRTCVLPKTWAPRGFEEREKVAEEVARMVRENHITQVVFGRSAQTGWKRYLYLSAIHRFLRDAPPVDVHIVTQEMK